MIPPNVFVGQVAQYHQKSPNDPLRVHLDLMPMQGMQLTKGDRLVTLDLPDMVSIKNNFKEIGELVVGLLNN